jgi:hypothetical protein
MSALRGVFDSAQWNQVESLQGSVYNIQFPAPIFYNRDRLPVWAYSALAIRDESRVTTRRAGERQRLSRRYRGPPDENKP